MNEQDKIGAAPERLIFTQMVKVMEEIGAIGKNKQNKQQGYSFRGIDDLYNAIQPALVKAGVFLAPEVLSQERFTVPTKSGGIMYQVVLVSQFTFFASDGSYVVATTLGEAMDSGDKASNKAMSAALKYALMQTFCIPTEGDNDTENNTPVMGSQPPQQQQPQLPQPAQPPQMAQPTQHPPGRRRLLQTSACVQSGQIQR